MTKCEGVAKHQSPKYTTYLPEIILPEQRQKASLCNLKTITQYNKSTIEIVLKITVVTCRRKLQTSVHTTHITSLYFIDGITSYSKRSNIYLRF